MVGTAPGGTAGRGTGARWGAGGKVGCGTCFFQTFLGFSGLQGSVVAAGGGQVRQRLPRACAEAEGLWLGRGCCGDVEGSSQARSDGGGPGGLLKVSGLRRFAGWVLTGGLSTQARELPALPSTVV